MEERKNVSKERAKWNLQLIKLREATESFFKGAKFDDCANYLDCLKSRLDEKSRFSRIIVENNRLCCEIMIQSRTREPCFQKLKQIYYDYLKISTRIQYWKPSVTILSLELAVVYNLCWLGIVLNSDNEMTDEWQRICIFSLRRSIENRSNTDVKMTKTISDIIYERLIQENFNLDPMFLMCVWCLTVSSSSEEIIEISKLVSSGKPTKEVVWPLMGFVSSGTGICLNLSYLTDLFRYSNALKSSLSKDLSAIENENLKPFSSYLSRAKLRVLKLETRMVAKFFKVYLGDDEIDLENVHKFPTELRSEFLNATGCLVAAKGKRHLALQYFKEAIQADPSGTGTLVSLFNTSVQFKHLGLLNAERSALQLVLQKSDEELNNLDRPLLRSTFRNGNDLNKDILHAVACRFFSHGSYYEAADAFTKLKSLYYSITTDVKKIFQRVCYSLVVCGRNEEASKMMNEFNDDPVLSFIKGVLLIRKKQFLEALPVFQSVVDRVSKDDNGNIESDRSKRLKSVSGVDACDELKSLAFCNIGLLNVVLGKSRESIRYLETSHRLNPGNSDILYNYCLSLVLTGNKLKAYKLWNSKRPSCNGETKNVSQMDMDTFDKIAKRRYSMDYSLPKIERIGVRRERIVKEQQKSKGIILPELKTTVEKKSKSEERILICDNHLAKVTKDSRTLVENVRKAAAEYEAERISSVAEEAKQRLERLEQEGRVGAEHFKDISSKWLDTFKLQVPSELYERMVEQKNACDAVIREKDKLIEDLKKAIEAKGIKYEAAIERQEEEVQMTVDRCREQVLLLGRCYDEDLNDIEEALIEEWTEIFNNQAKEWDEKLLELNSNNSDRVSEIRTLFDKWEKELEDIRVEKVEETRAIRLKLEGDVERLEQMLESTKAVLQLNEEKLEYGCQVLRKQCEDQMTVKANQKRKMIKLKDNLTALKLKVSELELSNKEKTSRIERDCERIQQKILEYQKRMSHFERVDRQKLDELWRFNDETVRKLVKELLDIDKYIHERILHVSWEPPSLLVFVVYIPTVEPGDTPAQARAVRDAIGAIAIKMESRKDEALKSTILDDLVQTAPIYAKPLSCSGLFRVGILTTRGRTTSRSRKSGEEVNRYEVPDDVRQEILRTLAKKGEFLTEQRFDLMTKALSPDEQLLVQLDSIFSALNIQKESEVESLVKYIYKNCCETTDPLPNSIDGSEVVGLSDEACAITKLPSIERINSAKILKVINEFLDRRNRIQSAVRNRTRKENEEQISGNKVDTDWEFKCSDYWAQFTDLFPSSKEKLWDAVLDGLKKLRKCVLEHSKLTESNRRLRAHNEELEFLLSEYQDSRKVQGHEHG